MISSCKGLIERSSAETTQDNLYGILDSPKGERERDNSFNLGSAESFTDEVQSFPYIIAVIME